MSIVPLPMAILPLVGLRRARRLQAFLPDPRLRAFQCFFGLYAVGVILRFGGMALQFARDPSVAGRMVAMSVPLEVISMASSAFTVVALAVVAFAYVRRGPSGALGAPVLAAAPLFLVWHVGGDVLAAALALVPAWFTFRNHRTRPNSKSPKIALGFFLLALGQLGFVGLLVQDAFILAPISQVTSLVGIATLVFAFPRAK